MALVPSVLVPNSPIFIVGEAPGREEDEVGIPFVGPSGRLLDRLLANARISRAACSIGNVLRNRPPENRLEAFCCDRAALPPSYSLRPLIPPGKYLAPAHLPDLADLAAEIIAVKPNLVLAMGATASWALLGQAGVKSVRGYIQESTLCPGVKVLPTWHPAMILRQFDQWPTLQLDLEKARAESLYPEIRRPARTVSIPDHPLECWNWWERHGSPRFAVDIETAAGLTTMVGLAPDAQNALVVPFAGPRDGSYWPTVEQECLAWKFLAEVLGNPAAEVIFHNGIYDLTYLCFQAQLPVRATVHDTMIAHHALQPGIEKSLHHLGAIYTNESAWKTHYRRVKARTDKRDD